MQDGASPHCTKKVGDLLDTLPVGWIGHRRPIDWAPRSCDLMPMDFSIWEMIKHKVLRKTKDTVSAASFCKI